MRKHLFDRWFLLSSLGLLSLGMVMVASTSLPLAEGAHLNPWHFVIRQTAALVVGGFFGWCLTYIPLSTWQKWGLPLLILNLVALTLLLIPGLSHPVNGSTRWFFLGPISLQVSEFAKLGIILYIAGYLVRHQAEVREKTSGFLKPMVILALMASLLLLEPDFGAIVVTIVTVMGMLFLGGVPFHRFLILFTFILLNLLILLVTSPYRMERLTSFLNPWADQFNSGYQLTQSLIAFGRGGWFGTGLGGSIQKLLYLPEPHTDFLYAVLAEELGLFGALAVLALFGLWVGRALSIGRKALAAGHPFGAFLAYGIALWVGAQATVNIGVNLGVLPTKGLTLPFMSYGGSSLVVGLMAIGLLLRVDFESR